METEGDEHPKKTEGGEPPEEVEGDNPPEETEGEGGEPPKKKGYPEWRKKSLERKKKGMSYVCHKEAVAVLVTATSGAATIINTTAHVDCKVAAWKELHAPIHEDCTLLVLELAELQAEVERTNRKVDCQESHAEK